jgi:glycosyltransferase involved in cell wall biosynthesis
MPGKIPVASRKSFMTQKTLEIGIVARGLSEPVGGVRQYIRDITDALIRCDPINHYTVFYNSDEFIRGYENAREVVIHSKSKLLWDHFFFPRRVSRYNLDFIFCPKTVIPLGVKIPAFITVHDLLYFPIPGKIVLDEYKGADTLYMRWFIPRSIRKSVHVFADSHSTRDDIFQLFKTPKEKVSVVHLGLSSFAEKGISQEEATVLLANLEIPSPFIFYAGVTTRRKNIATLIRAMGSIREQLPHHLIITGGGNEKSVSLREVIVNAGMEERTHILGMVPHEILAALYKKASAFVFPSLYEGFGLPVLEAMALECPVICSNSSSIPEVAGDAALLFDPSDEVALAGHILSLWKSPDLREKNISAGKKRAAEFTWDKAAKMMINAFEKEASQTIL